MQKNKVALKVRTQTSISGGSIKNECIGISKRFILKSASKNQTLKMKLFLVNFLSIIIIISKPINEFKRNIKDKKLHAERMI